MATNTIDPEKGLITASARPALSSLSSSSPDKALATDPSEYTPLQLFQLLVGIHTPLSLIEDGAKSTRGRTKNVGLYRRAKQQERASRLAYQSTSVISNTLFLLQIVLAATFTAMSAWKDSHRVTLTVLGAANTVVAGCLAWQKGQGVPQRYRKAQDEYQALLLEIEMAERSFLDVRNNPGEDDVKLDPRAERDRLQKLFDTARGDQQANYPDLYVSTGAAAAKGSEDLKKELEDAKAEAAKVQTELLAKIDALVAKAGGKVEGAASDVAAAAPSASKA